MNNNTNNIKAKSINVIVPRQSLVNISKNPSLYKRELELNDLKANKSIKDICDIKINDLNFKFNYLLNIKGNDSALYINPYNIRNQIISFLNLDYNVDDNTIINILNKLKYNDYKSLYKSLILFDFYLNSSVTMSTDLKEEIFKIKKSNIHEINNEMQEKYKREYCENYLNEMISIIKNYSKIKNYFLSNPINIIDKNKIDIDSFKFSIIKRNIDYVKTLKNIEDIKVYLSFIKKYFKENENLLGKGIYFSYNNKKVMFDSTYYEYKSILSKFPNLDENKSIKEKTKVNENISAWSFLDKDNTIDKDRIEKAISVLVKYTYDYNLRKKKENELRELLYSKINLFESLNYYKKVKGVKKFNGYVAYIFDNGKVLLEKYFDKNQKGEEIIAHEEAIYVMDIDEFYELSHLSKTELIKNKLCKRIFHAKDYENKVINVINEEGKDPKAKYLELVKNGYIIER